MSSGTYEDATLLGEKTLLVWRVCLTLAHTGAIISSIFRLYRRRKTGHFWLDDYFAMGAFAVECSFFPTLWTRGSKSRSVLIATSWMSQLLFLALLWCTRMSLAFSIARVIPPHQKMRKAAILLVYMFGALFWGFFIQTSVFCTQTYRKWSQNAPYQCSVSSSSAVARVVADCFCDLALILVPFCAFWRRLKLPLTRRRLIQACFSASMFTAICSMLSAGILFRHRNSKLASERAETSFMASVMSHLMASISLLVCNILIVVTSFYRFVRPEEVVREIGAPQQQPAIQITIPALAIQPPQKTTEIGGDRNPQADLESDITSSQTQNHSHPRTKNEETPGNHPCPFELTEIFESDYAPSEIQMSMTTIAKYYSKESSEYCPPKRLCTNTV